MRALRKALPLREWQAVSAWLTTFHPYQLEWLLDWGRFSLLNKARQIGASHTYGAAAVLWALLNEPTAIVSKGQTEADDVLEKSYGHATVLVRLGSHWAKPTQYKQGTLRLATGKRIRSVPSTGAARGHSSNVLLDEVAYHEHPDKVWDSAAGAIMHGYRIRVFSTPNGVGNFWHTFWTDPKWHEGYRKHEVTIDDAKAQGLLVDDEANWRMAHGDPRVYDQLFRCKFVDNLQQYLPTAAIEACTVDNAFCYEGRAFAGLDVGRTSDRTELVIIKVDRNGVRWLQHAESRKRTSQDDIDALAALAFSPQYRCRRLCVDATGLGTFPAEKLQKKYGRTRVEPVNFTLNVKEDLATGLYWAFTEPSPADPEADEDEPQRGMVRIPRDDTLLRDELCSIRRIITSAGNVRYDAPQTDKGHADRAWALALALHACSGPDRTRHVVHDHDTTAEQPNAAGFIFE